MANLEVRAGRLLDGSGGPAIADAAVQVSGELLTYAGPAATAPPAPAGTALVDLGPDVTLLPGLIDCHAHPLPHADLPELGPEHARDGVRLLYAVHVLAGALVKGMTTFRDCGAPRMTAFALKTAVDAGLVPGPRLRVAGHIICPTGGHGYSQGGEVDGADGVRQAARQLFKQGADFIKITATGGGTVPGPPRHRATFTVAEIAAAVEVAEQHDSYVTAHCHSTEGIVRCLDAGVPMLEHATFVGPDGREHLDRAVLTRISDQGVTVCPTVAVHGRWLDEVAGQPDDADRAVWSRRADSFARRLDLVAELHAAGVPVLIGSDGGFGRSYPAALDDLAYSVALHVRAGVPAADAIVSATSLAADKIGMGDLVGRLAPGLQADVLAVTGDPLAEIEALERVRLVLQHGEVIAGTAG